MYGAFTYICLIFIANVGKYSSPMDAMGTTHCDCVWDKQKIKTWGPGI